MKTTIGLLLLLAFPVAGFAETSLKITSSAFSAGEKMASKYTCDGSNLNPPLHISNIPKTAKSLAVVDDPDAPGQTWVHWLIWNIDPKTTQIAENSVPQGATQGTSDFDAAKYGGLCPPSGTHRYYFKVDALDANLSLPSSSKKAALEKAMAGHILAEGSLMGTYSHSE